MTERIALLAWGSLLWEGGDEFDAWHEPWQFDGPELKIEFTRISAKRLGALTLVIDAEQGTLTKVAYCLSRRRSIAEVVADLRRREKTSPKTIGRLVCGGSDRCRDRESKDAISAWAMAQTVEGVVWTDLPSNFGEKTKRPFSVTNALTYLSTLPPDAKARASEYFHRAPNFVRTPLRDAVKQQCNSLGRP